MQTEREITFFENHFMDFYLQQPEAVRKKIEYVLSVIRKVERVPEKFLKHIEGTKGLYEIRVEQGSNAYRIFCCFDKGNVVVLFNAFHKKSQKTPTNEIELALKLMNLYFRQMENQT
ncbi:MAG: type II toxin-antitoxin system RelE/ParE family toxin [Bacteroidota bacterium]